MSENTDIRDVMGMNDKYNEKYGMSLSEAQMEMKKTSEPDFNNEKTKLASKIVNIEASRVIIAEKALKKEAAAIKEETDKSFVEDFVNSLEALEIQKKSLKKRESIIKKKLQRLFEMKESRNKRYDEHADKECRRALQEISGKLKAIEGKISGGKKNGKKSGNQGTENKGSQEQA